MNCAAQSYLSLANLPDDTFVLKREQIEETDVHCFTAMASDLGFPPGEFPRNIRVEGKFGNDQTLFLKQLDEHAAEYQQGNGCICLTVFND